MKNKLLCVIMAAIMTLSMIASAYASTSRKYMNSSYGYLEGSCYGYISGSRRYISYSTTTTHPVPVIIAHLTVTYKGSGAYDQSSAGEYYEYYNKSSCGYYWESHVNNSLARVGYASHEARTDTQAWGVYTSCEV